MINEIEEFWSLIKSDDCQMQEEGFQKWYEFKKNRPEYVDGIKKKLSNDFYHTYNKMSFHDFQLCDIKYSHNPPSKSTIELLLYDYHETYGKNLYYSLVYSAVSSYTIDIKSTKYAISWGNDIFEDMDEGLLKHRILCSDNISIDIVFKKIRLKRLKAS